MYTVQGQKKMQELSRRILSCSLILLGKAVQASIQTDANAEDSIQNADVSKSSRGTLQSQAKDISALMIGGWYVFPKIPCTLRL